MSYIPEPYDHIADQVLTGLTGGKMRQSYRFFPKANSFGFEVDAATVLVDTVRVFGQVNESFFSFQPGRDFVIGGDGQLSFPPDPDDAGLPAKGVSWPDEGSEFFVRYYHRDSDKALITDRHVGSLSRTLAEAFARELAVLRKQLELVYKSGFLETARDKSLEKVVRLLGVTRKSREFATGSVRFFRDTPAPADIHIPEGTRISTNFNPPVVFVTVAEKRLRRGQLSVESDIRAEQKGAPGVVPEGTITAINQIILGINGVTNSAPTLFGASSEGDDELRSRAKKVLEKAGRATPVALKNALMSIGGLKENDIKVVEELVDRPGAVKVFVVRKSGAQSVDDKSGYDLAMKVDDAILNSRAAGIRVEHNLPLPPPERDLLSDTEEGREEGETRGLPSVEMDGFQLQLNCTVTVYSENPRITGAEKIVMEKDVLGSVIRCVDASSIGGGLVYNRIVTDAMMVAGVSDVDLAIRCKGDDSTAGRRNINIPEGRRAVLEEKDIALQFAGAPVYIDVYMKVVLLGGAGMAAARKEINDRLALFFAGVPGEVTFEALKGGLEGGDNYTLDEASLTFSAEYDQAGLVVKEKGGQGASLSIAEGSRAVLRNINVEEKV